MGAMSYDPFDPDDAVRDVPLRMDRLLSSRPLTHRVSDGGPNRAPIKTCAIEAKDDLDAITAWLLEHHQSPETVRSYKKEIERFYNWLVLIQRKSLGGVTPDDVDAYDLFMSAPPQTWCGPRNGNRKTGRWRPFENALSVKSRSQTKTILRACFSYLVAVRYVVGNPISQDRPTRKQAGGESSWGLGRRYIPLPAFRKLIEALELQAAAPASKARRALATAERQLFVVRFLANTGLRGEELASAKLSDIACEENALTHRSNWAMSVGKAEAVRRKIAVNATALDALRRYRQVHEMGTLSFDKNAPVLLPLTGTLAAQKFLTPHMVYTISMEALKVASLHYASTDAETSALLAKATPHWFRTTFATIASQRGIAQAVIQQQLGVASLQPTALLHSTIDDLELFDMVAMLDF